MSTLDSFSCAFVTGGSGGLGRAMGESLIKSGKKVIIAGRTESKLKDAAKEMGAACYYVLDTGDISKTQSIVQKLIKEHPDVDCLINNAGVQTPFRFPGCESKDDDYTFDLSKADTEIDINIRGPMYLVLNMLPHFQSLAKQGKPSTIINVSSLLGYNPVSIINPVYNGTKAWLHSFTMNLRSQLKASSSGDKIKVIEIAPPQVATDLHRGRVDPDDNKGDTAMTVPAFMEEVEKGWSQGKEIIAPGPAGDMVQKWYGAFEEGYLQAVGS